jgi:hypothetical protein
MSRECSCLFLHPSTTIQSSHKPLSQTSLTNLSHKPLSQTSLTNLSHKPLSQTSLTNLSHKPLSQTFHRGPFTADLSPRTSLEQSTKVCVLPTYYITSLLTQSRSPITDKIQDDNSGNGSSGTIWRCAYFDFVYGSTKYYIYGIAKAMCRAMFGPINLVA